MSAALIAEARKAMDGIPDGGAHRMPVYNGDGYEIGGLWMLTFDARAYQFGPGDEQLTKALANAPSLVRRLIEALELAGEVG